VVSINECGNFAPIDKLLQSEPSVVYSDEFMQLTDDFIEQDPHIEEYMLSGIAEKLYYYKL
jgi:hypothetical protein